MIRDRSNYIDCITKDLSLIGLRGDIKKIYNKNGSTININNTNFVFDTSDPLIYLSLYINGKFVNHFNNSYDVRKYLTENYSYILNN